MTLLGINEFVALRAFGGSFKHFSVCFFCVNRLTYRLDVQWLLDSSVGGTISENTNGFDLDCVMVRTVQLAKELRLDSNPPGPS